MSKAIAFLASAAIAIALAGPASGQGSATSASAGQPWLNPGLSPEARARAESEQRLHRPPQHAPREFTARILARLTVLFHVVHHREKSGNSES